VFGLLAPLFDFLKCLVLFAVGCVEWVLFTVINLLIAAVAGLVGVVLGLLPSVTLPTIALPSSFAWANYFLPMDQVLLALAVILAVAVAWPLARLLLNWVKAL